MGEKQTIRLKNWWLTGGHIYGQNIDDQNKQVRSARSKELLDPTNDLDSYCAGDIISTHAVNYLLIGLKRRKFSDD